MRLILPIAFLSVIFSNTCAAEQGNSDNAKIAEAINAFTVNKESIGTFAAYIDGEHSLLVLDPSVVRQESVAGLFEAVVAAHEASEWYRRDINHDLGREGTALPSRKWESGITWKGEQFTFSNQEEMRRPSPERPAPTRLPLFDPWTLSISSFGLFRYGNAGRNDFLRVQDDVNLKEVRYLGGGIVRGTWVLPPKYMEKFEVDFAEGAGFMPVQTRTWIRAFNGKPDDLSEDNWPILHSVVKTKWRQWEDGRWFPITIAVSGFTGPAKRPIQIDQWYFKFSWVPRSEVNGDWGRISENSGPVLASKVKEAATLVSGEGD
jgi:hypothetical protein